MRSRFVETRFPQRRRNFAFTFPELFPPQNTRRLWKQIATISRFGETCCRYYCSPFTFAKFVLFFFFIVFPFDCTVCVRSYTVLLTRVSIFSPNSTVNMAFRRKEKKKKIAKRFIIFQSRYCCAVVVPTVFNFIFASILLRRHRANAHSQFKHTVPRLFSIVAYRYRG